MADRKIHGGDDINSGKLDWQLIKHVSSVFDGNTNGQHGDEESGGTSKPTYTIWTVTGNILVMKLWGICNTSLTGNIDPTLQVGVVGNIDSLIDIVDATGILDGDVIFSAVASAGIGEGNPVAQMWQPINDGANIIETTVDENIDSGQIDYYMIWAPAEVGANVVGAGTLS